MKKDKDLLAVARILKPQGVRGELKVLPLTDLPDDLLGITEVVVNGKTFAVRSVSARGGFCYFIFDGVCDRNAAELLRDNEIFVDTAHRPKLKEGHFYISDLIGSDIVDENGRVLGVLSDVLQYGAADVYEVNADKPFSFPAIKAVITEYAPQDGKIFINSTELEKVAVYED